MFNRPILAVTAAAAMLALAACEDPAPKTSAGGIPLGDYVMVGIGGGTVPLRNITLTVEEKRVSGRGPCNGYSAANGAELPALALSAFTSTQVACKELPLENRFFQTLQSATEMEYYGGVLKVKSASTWLIFERGRPQTEQVSALEAARGTAQAAQQ